MEKAKAAVGDFMSKSGQKDTTVHETVNPAITKETVKPTRHDETQTAVDKEIHQDHYHTSVQPVRDSEVLPEKHTHQVLGTEERAFVHGNAADDKARVAEQHAQFKDERTVAPTQHSTTAAPALAGEHVHHHVHETIQPVVHKETIQPEVVHTTQPVHEVHHNEALHHGTHELPEMHKSELEAKGLPLAGRGERTDHFTGEPKPVDGHPGATALPSTSTTSSTVPASSASAAAMRSTGTDSGIGSNGTTSESADYSSTKPSLMDKLNPKVDSTGDGKAGFMK